MKIRVLNKRFRLKRQFGFKSFFLKSNRVKITIHKINKTFIEYSHQEGVLKYGVQTKHTVRKFHKLTSCSEKFATGLNTSITNVLSEKSTKNILNGVRVSI